MEGIMNITLESLSDVTSLPEAQKNSSGKKQKEISLFKHDKPANTNKHVCSFRESRTFNT